MNTQYLSITWSTSRGRDTYGYNICKLSAGYNGTVYRTCGGGYDMVGTVVGEWLQANYQERLLALGMNACAARVDAANKYESRNEGMYGMCYRVERKKVDGRLAQVARITLDGGCGIESMRKIAEAIGLSLTATVNRKGHATGYMVTDYGSAEALRESQK